MTTLGGHRPGLPLALVAPILWWRPCLTRARDCGTPLTYEHCWFLDLSSSGTFYCWACRIGQPQVVVGPRAQILELRRAITAGDRAYIDELVHRILSRTPACPTVGVGTPAPAILPAGTSSSPSTAHGVRSFAPDGDCPSSESSGPGALGHGGSPREESTQLLAAKESALPHADTPLLFTFIPRDLADWREFWTERAAVGEYLGGLTRAEAEVQATVLAGRMPRAA